LHYINYYEVCDTIHRLNGTAMHSKHSQRSLLLQVLITKSIHENDKKVLLQLPCWPTCACNH